MVARIYDIDFEAVQPEVNWPEAQHTDHPDLAKLGGGDHT
jgi:hypothetical protein